MPDSSTSLDHHQGILRPAQPEHDKILPVPLPDDVPQLVDAKDEIDSLEKENTDGHHSSPDDQDLHQLLREFGDDFGSSIDRLMDTQLQILNNLESS